MAGEHRKQREAHDLQSWRVVVTGATASSVQIEDIGFATVHGKVDTYVADGGVRRELRRAGVDRLGEPCHRNSIHVTTHRASQSTGLAQCRQPRPTGGASSVRSPTSPLLSNFEWQSLDNALKHQQLHLAPYCRGPSNRLTKQLSPFEGQRRGGDHHDKRRM